MSKTNNEMRAFVSLNKTNLFVEKVGILVEFRFMCSSLEHSHRNFQRTHRDKILKYVVKVLFYKMYSFVEKFVTSSVNSQIWPATRCLKLFKLFSNHGYKSILGMERKTSKGNEHCKHFLCEICCEGFSPFFLCFQTNHLSVVGLIQSMRLILTFLSLLDMDCCCELWTMFSA